VSHTDKEDDTMRRPPRGRSGFTDHAGLRLHHLSYGEDGRQPMLIIPGITSPAITWEFVAEELQADFAVTVVDLRGRGLSGTPPEGGYAMDDYADDMEAVITGLGLDRPVVVGHSLGARVAAALGARSPALTGALVIIDPPLTGPGRAEYPTPVESFREQLREAREGTTAEGVLRFFPSWSREAAELRAEWLDTCDERAVVDSWHAFHDEDFMPAWRRLRPPVLFVYGEESPVITAEGLAEVRAENPDAEIAGIADAGHMIPWENLADFLAVLRRFAGAHAARG
jgi:N-formylmaleamate deformylase